MHTRTHAHMHTCTHTHTCTRAHTQTHARTHAHTHAWARTHTHRKCTIGWWEHPAYPVFRQWTKSGARVQTPAACVSQRDFSPQQLPRWLPGNRILAPHICSYKSLTTANRLAQLTMGGKMDFLAASLTRARMGVLMYDVWPARVSCWLEEIYESLLVWPSRAKVWYACVLLR